MILPHEYVIANIIKTVGSTESSPVVEGLLGSSDLLSGLAGPALATFSSIDNFQQMRNGDMDGLSFTYNTTAVWTSFAVGEVYNPVVGGIVGAGFVTAPIAVQGFNNWFTQFSGWVSDFNNGLKVGWVPGRY
jgi:hypothetical protein